MADDAEHVLPSDEKNDTRPITPEVNVVLNGQKTDGRINSYGAIPDDDGNHDDKSPSATEEGLASGTNEQEAPPMTRSQKLTFIGIALIYLFCFASFSVLAPFFPYEAEKKGATPTETGLVFGCFALVNFISAPFLGKYLPIIGAKFMFLSGAFVAAGCNLLFGFLDQIYGRTIFLTYCFVIRTVEAVGASATVTAGMAIVANTFPSNVAQMGGMLELFSGLGFAIGPPLGSLFYGLGGYSLPFIVLGCTAMVITVIDVFIIPSVEQRQEDKKSGSLWSVAKIPAVWIILIACMWASASLGFTDPTLSLHITSPPFNASPGSVGYMFLLIGGMYGLTAPIWGYLADKKKNTRIMIVLGFYLTGISYLFLGPSPLFSFLPNQLWVVVLGLGLLGVSIGCALMPTFLDLLVTAKWYGLPDDLSTQAVISGVFNSAYCLGSFIGPTVAGVLVDNLGFDWSSTIFAMGNFLVMIMVSLFGVWEYQCGRGRRRTGNSVNESYPEIQERSPLVVNS